jgi:hypothetical protein
MTVAIDKVREGFAGDAVTTAFPTTLLATSDDQVEVWDFDETVTPATVTQLLLGIGCTVTLNTPLALPSTLTIDVSATHPTGLPVDHTLIVIRRHPLTQDESFVPGDRFPDAVLELVLDEAILQAQYAKWRSERAPSVPVEDPDGQDLAIPNVADRAGKVATYDALGKPSAAALSTLSPSSVLLSALSQALLPDNSAASWRATLAVVQRAAGWQKVDADVAASRPAAAAFGVGVYVETDTRRIFYSNATAWTELTVSQFTNALLPAAATAGRILLDTDQRQLYRDTGAALQLLRSLPPLYKSGCEMVWTGVAGFTVNAGLWRDSTDAMNMPLLANMAKVCNSAGSWTAGAAGNAFPAGALFANGKFRVFLISKPDGTTDWGCDTDASATNLLAAAASYTRFRRIGWIYVSGGALIQWAQSASAPDLFLFDNVQTGWDDAGDVNYTGGVTRVLTAGFPNTEAIMAGTVTNTGVTAVFIITNLNQTSAAPLINNPPGSYTSGHGSTAGTNDVSLGQITILLDASAQIHARGGDADSRLHLFIHGWRDARLV